MCMMQDAVNILGRLLDTSFFCAGLLYLVFWIAERKPTNLEAVYIFAGVFAIGLVINFIMPFVDSTALCLLIFLSSLAPSVRRRHPKF
jgi:hypothetical protein